MLVNTNYADTAGGQFNWIELPCVVESTQYATIDHTALTNGEYKLLAIKVRVEGSGGPYIGSFCLLNHITGGRLYPATNCAQPYSTDYTNVYQTDLFTFYTNQTNYIKCNSPNGYIQGISAIGCVIDESNVDAWLDT